MRKAKKKKEKTMKELTKGIGKFLNGKEFIFENIGAVESATIEVGGLTVITGLNDSGKSFLSKSIYSIIKTNKEAIEQANLIKAQALQSFFEKLQNAERVSLLGVVAPITQKPTIGAVEIFNKMFLSLTNNALVEQVLSELETYQNRISENFNLTIHPVARQNASGHIKVVADAVTKINALLSTVSNPEKDNIEFFNKIIIQQLFKGQINNIGNSDGVAQINVNNGDENIVCLKIKNNIIEDFKGTINNYFTDAILIESPVVLQLLTFIINGLAFSGGLMPTMNLYQPRIAGLPLHFYDLINKIVNNVGNTSSEEYVVFINKVKEIIGGRVYYDPVSRSILFDKNNQGTIRDYNIASGIKSLGMLGILLAENILSKKTLLIIDEPEVHLHPKWEIQYAEIIVELCKAGIPIVISSHSPYLIESLLKYSKKNKIENKTKFYFGHESENGLSIFRETEDLKPIFKVLAEPMHTLI